MFNLIEIKKTFRILNMTQYDNNTNAAADGVYVILEIISPTEGRMYIQHILDYRAVKKTIS